MTIDTEVNDEQELKELARAITQYSTTNISDDDVDKLVKVSAMRVETKTGTDKWFSDRALGQALLYTLCIELKAAVENYSVDAWEIGDESIEVADGDGEASAQFTQWATAVAEGIEESTEVTGGYVPSNTSSFIG